ncbi:MAG: peptide deformylase [Candidatus Saccharicenans sp.]
MAIREIITIGHPTLARKASPVENIDGHIIELARDMVETMHQAPGIGLAAPQVNESLRLITVDLSVGKKREDLFIMINPEILEFEGEQVSEEGCLSVPGIYEKVVRPRKILVQGYDLDGREIRLEAEDLLARVFCHEIDHLEGKLFIDRLSPLKRRLLRSRLKKQLEKD